MYPRHAAKVPSSISKAMETDPVSASRISGAPSFPEYMTHNDLEAPLMGDGFTLKGEDSFIRSASAPSAFCHRLSVLQVLSTEYAPLFVSFQTDHFADVVLQFLDQDVRWGDDRKRFLERGNDEQDLRAVVRPFPQLSERQLSDARCRKCLVRRQLLPGQRQLANGQ
jgi:hypothetical protein